MAEGLQPAVGIHRQGAVEIKAAGQHVLPALPALGEPEVLHQHQLGRGEAPPRRAVRTVAEGRSLALTHNLGGGPGECVSFVSVVGTEREV